MYIYLNYSNALLQDSYRNENDFIIDINQRPGVAPRIPTENPSSRDLPCVYHQRPLLIGTNTSVLEVNVPETRKQSRTMFV